MLDQVYCGRRGSAVAAYRLPSRQFLGEPMGMKPAIFQVCNWLQLAQGQTTLPFAKGYISCVVLRLQHSRRGDTLSMTVLWGSGFNPGRQ